MDKFKELREVIGVLDEIGRMIRRLITKLEDRINTLNQIQIEEGNNSFYVDLKRFVITGYFNSEIGVKQALNYRPIPGEFKGCIPLEEAEGKSWS